MEASTRFFVSRPQVIQETFDDEIVIVDLDSGNYYSLGKIGADAWNLLEQGRNFGEITQSLAHAYSAETGVVASAMADLLTQLQSENLISQAETRGIEYSNSDAHSDYQLNAAGEVFQVPTLQKFTDMQELLLLDPIHEVDSSGWPNIKA